MPGVYRPYTFADIVGSLQDQIGAAGADSTSAGTGYFLEADETIGVTDSATVTAQAAAGTWDSSAFGRFSWG